MLIQLLFGLVPISGVKNTNTASGFREVDQTFRTRAYLMHHVQNRNQWKISKAGLTHKVCEYDHTALTSHHAIDPFLGMWEL
jgi:hypothetical protein